MAMEATENSLYSLLIGISKDVGEIKADVKNTNSDVKEMQAKVELYNTESAAADNKVATKLEEYFQYAKNRQDGIKAELETKIGNVRADLNTVATRVTALEEKPKNKLWDLFVQFKGVFITALIAALVGVCMKFMTDIVKLVKQPTAVVPVEKVFENPPEKPHGEF